jgi:glycerol-3-phosphate dehydrogenase
VAVLSDRLTATDALADLADCDPILLMAPAQQSRRLVQTLATVITPPTTLVLCAKGPEQIHSKRNRFE